MKNYNKLKNHILKYYKKARAAAMVAERRFDARGINVPMTPAGLRAELRRLDREEAATLARLDAAAAAPVIEYINIHVEWNKSRMWGYNPRAAVTVYGVGGGCVRSEGRASGCGYDKESAAVAHALAGVAMYDRFIFENWARCSDGDHPYYYDYRTRLPEFGLSGAGVGELRRFAEKCGYKWTESHGKMSDHYTIEKKGGRNAHK